MSTFGGLSVAGKGGGLSLDTPGARHHPFDFPCMAPAPGLRPHCEPTDSRLQ